MYSILNKCLGKYIDKYIIIKYLHHTYANGHYLTHKYTKNDFHKDLFPWNNHNTINYNVLLNTKCYTHKQHFTNILQRNFYQEQIRDTIYVWAQLPFLSQALKRVVTNLIGSNKN